MELRKIYTIVAIIAILGILLTINVASEPSGPSITYGDVSTSSISGTPTLEGNASISGGDIATLLLVATEQDDNWKAYVGNVSGSLVLQDSANYSIYEWPMGTPTGEVYATRTSSTITWSSITCANVTNVAEEESEMGHTAGNTPTDSINATFNDDTFDHWGFDAGSKTIASNSCAYSINPYVNGTTQTADIFEEVLLYDGSNILYTSRIQNNLFGYHSNITFDFQMLVAENASAGASRTNYYFYVELI